MTDLKSMWPREDAHRRKLHTVRLRLCAVLGKENPAETGCGKGAWAGGGHTPFITRASRAAGRTDGEAGGERELSRGRRSGAGPPTATTRRADLRPREAAGDGFPCSRNGPPGLRVQKRLCSATCVETASSARSAGRVPTRGWGAAECRGPRSSPEPPGDRSPPPRPPPSAHAPLSGLLPPADEPAAASLPKRPRRPAPTQLSSLGVAAKLLAFRGEMFTSRPSIFSYAWPRMLTLIVVFIQSIRNCWAGINTWESGWGHATKGVFGSSVEKLSAFRFLFSPSSSLHLKSTLWTPYCVGLKPESHL